MIKTKPGSETVGLLDETKSPPADLAPPAVTPLASAGEGEGEAEKDRAAPAVETSPWLTTGPSDDFGPTGHIVMLTEDAARAAPEGLLIAPTPEQLSQRL